MTYNQTRELVRIRHELRKLVEDRDQFAATRLLDRMRALTAKDAAESADIAPEMQRWRVVFRLEG